MQWSGKVPPTGLTPALRERKEQDQINRQVREALDGDPAFAVRTVDGRHWICPYSGALVVADSPAGIREFLFRRRPWSTRRGGKPRPLFQILLQKWTHHLASDPDPRLRRFDDAGCWLNPFTGAAERLTGANPATDAAIAHALAGCVEAQGKSIPD